MSYKCVPKGSTCYVLSKIQKVSISVTLFWTSMKSMKSHPILSSGTIGYKLITKRVKTTGKRTISEGSLDDFDIFVPMEVSALMISFRQCSSMISKSPRGVISSLFCKCSLHNYITIGKTSHI